MKDDEFSMLLAYGSCPMKNRQTAYTQQLCNVLIDENTRCT